MKSTTFAVAAALLASPVMAQPAPMFRGDLAHTGVYASVPVTRQATVKWTFHTGGGVISSPAIDDGVAYVGSTDGSLYAVDIMTGVQKWRFRAGARVVSSPAVSGGAVLFESYDGFFYAVDKASGALRWKFAVPGERRFAAPHIHGSLPKGETMPDPFDFYLSSAAVWNGAVYFGSGDGAVYALDLASGALKWKFVTGDVVHASPAIADGVLYIGGWDSWFYALDAATGVQKWRFKTGEDPVIHNQVGIQSSAAVADGVVYFGCRDSNLYAVDAATGRQLWAYNNKGSWVIGSPAVDHGVVYAATADTGQFLALDAKTGAAAFTLDFKHWPMFSSPAIAGAMAYVGSHQGRLIAIDLAGRKVAWSFDTEASRTRGPAFTKPDGTPNYEAVYAGDFYDEIVAGVAKSMSFGAMLSSPVVADGVIYVGSEDGNLYALS